MEEDASPADGAPLRVPDPSTTRHCSFQALDGVPSTRLGAAIRKMFGLSLKQAKAACKDRRVLLNGTPSEDSRFVTHNDKISLLPAASTTHEQCPLGLVLRRADVAVVWKPAGVSIEPSHFKQLLGPTATALFKSIPKAMAALIPVGISEPIAAALRLPGAIRQLLVAVCHGQLAHDCDFGAGFSTEKVSVSRSRGGTGSWLSTVAVWSEEPNRVLECFKACGHPVVGDASPLCEPLGRRQCGRGKGKGKKMMLARVKLQLALGGQSLINAEASSLDPFAGFTEREARVWEEFHAKGEEHAEEAQFCGNNFTVSTSTMRPKGSSAPLVDAVTRLNPKRICELGVGCGSVLLTLLLKLPEAEGVGLEIDQLAVECCKRNIDLHRMSSRCKVMCGDFTQMHENPALRDSGPFDVVICNPPYHDRNDRRVKHLLESLNQEPEAAVFVPDGLDRAWCYRSIKRSIELCVPALLQDGGSVVLEVGAGMADEVEEVMAQGRWGLQDRLRDSRRMVRCLVFEWRSETAPIIPSPGEI